ncbi:hypothetical protein ACZ87_03839, partial [Candidatus Erwinia dacicola]
MLSDNYSESKVDIEERSEQVWHGKGNVLPFAVGQ